MKKLTKLINILVCCVLIFGMYKISDLQNQVNNLRNNINNIDRNLRNDMNNIYNNVNNMLEEESNQLTTNKWEYDSINIKNKTVEISADKVNEAITEQVEDIVAAIKEVLEKTPPELASDIMNRGIVMTGGGALLHGLDTLVSERTGLPTYIPEDAVSCVAIGTGLALQNLDVLNGEKRRNLI